MQAKLKIALIQGSIREGRFNDTISDWVTKRLMAQGFEVHVVDPAEPELLPLQTGDPGAVEALRARLADMDGFVVVTAEYNHAPPGPLKTLIDSAKAEWAARPVGLVSYGGISGGLRAAEILRLVFAELHAMTLRDSLSFAMPFGQFDGDGEMTDAAASERADMNRSGSAGGSNS